MLVDQITHDENSRKNGHYSTVLRVLVRQVVLLNLDGLPTHSGPSFKVVRLNRLV